MTWSAFAVWLTGLPASGKSTITAELLRLLESRGVHPTVLESDAMRRELTPQPTYADAERDLFYRAMVYTARRLIEHGVPVIIDATANRRAYRDAARQSIDRFIEVYVDCPLEKCRERDPKGIYARGKAAQSDQVPGLGATYEPPLQPEVVIHSDQQPPKDAAQNIVEALEHRGWLSQRR